MLHARRVVSAISLLFVGLFAIAHATEYPGAIPGGFSVGSQGSGTYTIPIATPAATGGLKPSLALTYNHLAGNGLAGMRWTLSGFSSITRCQQTYAQDEDVVAISYGSDDRYCLDGQRLVTISGGGSYHSTNTEYRTEIETFQRIIQTASVAGEAQQFTVEHGNGMKSYYGSTTDSRVEKVGASDVRIWYIASTVDQFGNTISYSYDENTSTGEVLPSGVSWTSNSGQGLSARYSVTINYESRPSADIRTGYLAGEAKWANTKRISSIEVDYNTSSEISTYTLSYASPVTTDTERSQLEEVLLCRGSDCLPETVFSWQDGTEGFDSASDSARPTGSNPLVGDFDNDGHMDLFVSLSSTWRIYKGTTAGGFEAAYNSGISSTTNPGKARVFDADGDGDSDLLYQSSSTWYLSKSTGSAMGSGVSTGISTSTAPEAVMMDFDGDGLTDWLYRDGSNNLKWMRNTGTGFASVATLETGVEYIGYEVNLPPADLNSDGRPDLMIGATGCYPWPPNCGIVVSVVTADGSGYTVTQVLGATTAFPPDSHAIDINGDGSDDMLFVNPLYNVWYFSLGRGDGTFNASSTSTGISYSGNSNSIALDYNHDGRTDLLSYDSGSAEYDVHLSTGSNLNSTAYTTVSSGAAIAMDVTGDGYRDLVYAGGDGDWHVRKASSDLADVVTSFTNGLGYGIDATYEPLAQLGTEHYMVDSGDHPSSVYQQQFNGSRYVVTHEDHDDGTGGTRNFSHRYDTAWLDRSGRGWLSFDWHVTYDLDNGTDTATWFHQDWPYAGRATLTRLRRTSDSQIIEENGVTWGASSWGSNPTRYFARPEILVQKNYEVGGSYDGVHLRTITDNPTYNTTYGYVDTRSVTTTQAGTSDVWTSYTDNDPSVNTTNWCIGLPGQVVTTNTNPDSSSKTRTLYHNWNSNCTVNYTLDKSEASTSRQLKTSYTYDGYSNPNVVSTDSLDASAQNRSVDYDYDSWGHFVTKQTVGTVGLFTSTTWDYVNAQPASVIGTDGLTVSYDYDSFGRLESETRPGTDSDYDYVPCGSCFPGDAVYYVHADHTDGSDDYEFFDALNRSVGTAWTLAGGAQGRKETEYNALGQVDRVSQPYVSGETKYWVTYDYDLIGRVTEEDAPVSESTTSGAITAYTYNGHEVWVTDAENNITKTLHNGAGQIEKVTDAASNYATYTYWPFGELKSMTDAESNTTTIDYDARGFKTDMSDPNMGDWEYVYNVYGELVSQTNALSDTTTMDYDEAGRLEERDEDEGTTNWYYYAYNDSVGERGKVETISAPGYYEAYEYSSSYGMPTMVLRSFDSENYVFDMTYDSHSRLDLLTYPLSTSGYRFEVDYDYDAYGHLDKVKDGNETYTYYTLNTTDALGRERTVSLGNGRNETREYDEGAGYLKTIATTGSVQDLEFTYDEVGNVLTRFDDLIDETETFTYDSLNRLATSQVSGESSVTIGYSAAGRITSKTGVGSYTYGAGAAGPMAVTSANGLSYTYDANGRMKTYGSDDITWYTYDKPKKVESGTETAEFWYGADRSRYMQVKASSGTPYATIHYASMLFEFEDAATDTYRHFVQAGDRVVAMVERVGTTNTKQFLHRDNQGSVTKVSNSGGTVDQALAFDAWGLRRDATDWSALGSPFAGSHATERGYTGHEHLDNVGLIHMNGRVQDPMLGRFISADPIIQDPYSTQSHNRYSYVWNNPASFMDPSGFLCEGADLSDCSADELYDILWKAAGMNPEVLNLATQLQMMLNDENSTDMQINAVAGKLRNHLLDANMRSARLTGEPSGVSAGQWRKLREAGLFGETLTRDEGPGRVTRTEIRTGAFIGFQINTKAFAFGFDIDLGSLNKDFWTGDKWVSTGFSAHGSILGGFGLEMSAWNRHIPVNDGAPGRLWLEPVDGKGWDVSPTHPFEYERNTRRRISGMGLSGGVGLGGSISYDPILHSISPAY